MDIGKLELSEAAWLCLGKLAMAVELEGGKRFAFRKSLAEILGLLEAAEASTEAGIRRRKAEFLQALSPAAQRLLARQRGAPEQAGECAPADEGASARYYRGAKVDAGDPPGNAGPAAKEAPVDAQGRKRIVYRGKVIYV